MEITTIPEFRKDLKNYIDKVIDDLDTLIVNRGKGKAVVVISLDDYNSLMATNHEMSSEKNVQRLDDAIEKMKNGKSFQRDLIEE